jgi:hypothetical protein
MTINVYNKFEENHSELSSIYLFLLCRSDDDCICFAFGIPDKAILAMQLNRVYIGIRRSIKIPLSVEVKQSVDFCLKEMFEVTFYKLT